MALEIERKYLLKSKKLIDLLQDEGLVLDKDSITQVYTRIDKKSEVRLRKKGDKYTMTSKIGDGMVREEKEEKVSEKLFKLAKKTAIGDVIKKSRYSFKLQNFPTSIDIYDGNLEGLVILEIEFPSQEIANSYKLFELFSQQIEKDVTFDSRFKNQNLALYGNPNFKDGWDLQKIFDGIKDAPFEFKFLDILPSSIEVYDGIRAVFYSMYEKIIAHQSSFLQGQNSEDLHQFRVNIRKTRSLLQSIDGVFEESIKDRFIQDLKLIATATNTKRDMDVFKEYLDTLDEIEAEDILEILEQEEIHTKEVCEMLQSETYTRVMQEWGVVLRDEDRFFMGEMAQEPYKKIGAISIIKRLKKMKKKLSVLDECIDVTYFHAVRIEFKRLRYLAESFSPFFANSSVDEMMKVSKKMQSLFGTLQDRDVGVEILRRFESSDEFAPNVHVMYSKEVVEEILNDEIYALRSDILMGKEALFKVLNSCIKDLKIYI